MIELVNTRLAEAGLDERLCPDLGSYIRYGVDNPKALILMTSGIRSRRLAHAIVADLPADTEPVHEQLRMQIARMGVSRVAYPVQRLRCRGPRPARLQPDPEPQPAQDTAGNRQRHDRTARYRASPRLGRPADPRTQPGRTHPAPLAVYASDQHIVTIPAQDQADLSAILDTGLAITVEIGGQARRPVLSISLPLAD